jgi:hypothetical protein
MLAHEDMAVLELAPTYDAFNRMGLDHNGEFATLRAKKGEKCKGSREARSLDLLQSLGLALAAQLRT